jgi:hypothetical protein
MDAQNVLIGMASLLTRHESSAVHNGGSGMSCGTEVRC